MVKLFLKTGDQKNLTTEEVADKDKLTAVKIIAFAVIFALPFGLPILAGYIGVKALINRKKNNDKNRRRKKKE